MVWRYRADASRITHRFLFLINAGLVITCFEIALAGRVPAGVAAWLTMAAVLGSNGGWHAWASYRSGCYSPGVITGVLLYVPTAVYGYYQFVHSGDPSIATAVIGLVVGGSYQIWSAAYHSGHSRSRSTRS